MGEEVPLLVSGWFLPLIIGFLGLLLLIVFFTGKIITWLGFGSILYGPYLSNKFMGNILEEMNPFSGFTIADIIPINPLRFYWTLVETSPPYSAEWTLGVALLATWFIALVSICHSIFGWKIGPIVGSLAFTGFTGVPFFFIIPLAIVGIFLAYIGITYIIQKKLTGREESLIGEA